ncbi:hypothetical protein O6H91_01G097900 [Diphasiastrum complanatum]|uniref:Uncharacterized protein n=2 Tax=Diphasiastrum complanatum TaxID=34168 RepID=A0ACC2ETW1_DIPCM|nr:hypothetical protein O6H91_01G097900 [Diphasiastrum complanatum]KAJ7569858.1 hypothetical protein O6H91_01G097900 [Diphasiastrum complanatum]
MPTIGVRLTSWHFKNSFKRSIVDKNGKTLVKRRTERRIPPNASFTDGVATKDCVINPMSGVSVRIFLPEDCLGVQTPSKMPKAFSWLPEEVVVFENNSEITSLYKEEIFDAKTSSMHLNCGIQKYEEIEPGKAYLPGKNVQHVKLPVIIEFHDGAFIDGSKDSQANEIFCRRLAKACRSVVIAVGYSLAPEHKYPCARDDGVETLRWLAKQASLVIFSSGSWHSSEGLIDSFGYMLADPWITAHVDYSRCVLLGAGAGGNIAEQVAREVKSLSMELEPIKIVAQVLICPLFGGVEPLPSEVLLADTYFLDRETMALVWKLVVPESENYPDHPAVDPLCPSQVHLLQSMPSTLVVSAELDMLRDRSAAYVDALRRQHVDATFLTYRNAVHSFATLESLMDTKPAQACLEDIAIWFGRHVLKDWN